MKHRWIIHVVVAMAAKRAPNASPPPETAPGDVERRLPLTHLSYHALLALAPRPLHGYGILKEIAALTGVLELETGTLYTAIRRLADEGLIEASPPPSEGADARRRYYRLTRLGARVLRAESERLAALVESARVRNAFSLAAESGR